MTGLAYREIGGGPVLVSSIALSASSLREREIDRLTAGYYALQIKSAEGVDGVTWKEYETGVESPLVDLHGRLCCGAYRA